MSSRDEGARDERAQAEEQAWREIVDHYGERPALPDEPEDLSLDDLETADQPDDLTDAGVVDGVVDRPDDGLVDPLDERPDHPPTALPDERPGHPTDPTRFVPYSDHFVPPPLPPPPDISPDRRFAWIGLVAPPLVLLLVVVLQYPLPGILTGALVVAFLGSFGYLVATMSREPRDPEDDGARL